MLNIQFFHICAQQAPTVVLGSLTGVFVVALAAVIIGWVWTCWTIKRRGGMNINTDNP